MSIVVQAIPEAVITPILLFVGIEIVSQAFIESPRKHVPAVAFAIMPVVAYLVLTYADSLIGKLDPSINLPRALTDDQNILRAIRTWIHPDRNPMGRFSRRISSTADSDARPSSRFSAPYLPCSDLSTR